MHAQSSWAKLELSGIKIDTKTYNSVLGTLAAAAETHPRYADLAEQCFKRVPNPDTTSYNHLFSALSKASQYSLTFALKAEEHYSQSPQREAYNYQALFNSLGSVKAELNHFKTLPAPDTSDFNHIIAVLVESGFQAEARVYLEDAVRKGVFKPHLGLSADPRARTDEVNLHSAEILQQDLPRKKGLLPEVSMTIVRKHIADLKHVKPLSELHVITGFNKGTTTRTYLEAHLPNDPGVASVQRHPNNQGLLIVTFNQAH